jgi:hypothetical protein
VREPQEFQPREEFAGPQNLSLGKKEFAELAFLQLLTEIGAPVFDDDRAAIGIEISLSVERTTPLAAARVSYPLKA